MENNKDKILKSRLDDFIKILKFRLVNKIDYHFDSNIDKFIGSTIEWNKWRSGEEEYSQRTYADIRKFNDCEMNRSLMQAIFGEDEHGRKISYESLISDCANVIRFNHGTITVNHKKIHYAARYVFNRETLVKIYEDKEELDHIRSLSKEYYSKRQLRIIYKYLIKNTDKEVATDKVQDVAKTVQEEVVAKKVDEHVDPKEMAYRYIMNANMKHKISAVYATGFLERLGYEIPEDLDRTTFWDDFGTIGKISNILNKIGV